ncbi:energy-coupling factor ABC transporter ATP-binding protein [Alicyclobacillus fodiniaquatilis]|uniref:Energy-coupling factor ABC transporter ATP-binding protein n=1 Tax=Alicyclobacillus fodiniaquatilis TaxID=1661150 RepID=A0ABW4JKU7_9BACL
MPTAIHMEDVSVLRHGQTKPILRQLSLNVQSGQWVALCGQNGAGKTTLARTLLGLCPIAAGRIRIHGHDVKEATAQQIQMVFQPPMAQLVGSTLYEELALTLVQRFPAINTADLLHQISDICQLVGLNVPIDASVHALSGGQLQRLCIAQALLSGAEVLLLDEASAALDADARNQLRHLLRELVKQGKTILFISHDMEDVLAADRVVLLADGGIVQDCHPADFFYDAQGTDCPARDFGFAPPFLVETALMYNRLERQHIKPCSESAFVEALAHVVRT